MKFINSSRPCFNKARRTLFAGSPIKLANRWRHPSRGTSARVRGVRSVISRP